MEIKRERYFIRDRLQMEKERRMHEERRKVYEVVNKNGMESEKAGVRRGCVNCGCRDIQRRYTG